MAALTARAFRIALSIVVPVALGVRLRRADAPVEIDQTQSERHPEQILDVTHSESRPVQTLQVTQSESRPEGVPPSVVDLDSGEWKYVFQSNFKQFYESVLPEYKDWRLVVFKDGSLEQPSQNMKDEIDALEKIRGWGKLGPDGVVKVVPVDVIVKDEQTVPGHAMAIEWIDGDFFDIAKLHKPELARWQVLLIAARGPGDEKVLTSVKGMMKWQEQLPDAEKLRSDAVQNKLQRMFASLNAINEVEAAIRDLQVMVRVDGQMVIIDPLAVGELPEQSSNLLGTGLTAPSFGNGAGHKFVIDREAWAENRARQTMNIDVALRTLQEALQSDQGLPKKSQRNGGTLALPTSKTPTLRLPTSKSPKSKTLKLPSS